MPSLTKGLIVTAVLGLVGTAIAFGLHWIKSPTQPTEYSRPERTQIEVTPWHIEGEGHWMQTVGYKPTDQEWVFFEQLSNAETRTGTSTRDYERRGKDGTYVGWFGIVRVLPSSEAPSELLVEHKYFNGLSDMKVITPSWNGSGSFSVRLRNQEWSSPRLVLVKAYGRVSYTSAGMPTVDTDYVRVWPWGAFSFIRAYGVDRTDPKWRAHCKVPDSEIYDHAPNDEYYTKRLGSP